MHIRYFLIALALFMGPSALNAGGGKTIAEYIASLKPSELAWRKGTFGRELKFGKQEIGSLEGLSQMPDKEKIQVLSLYGNKLTHIQPNDFRGFENVQTIALNQNQITSIDDRAFANQAHLKTLYLGSNPLATLNAGAFKGLNSLTDLFLDGTRIASLDDPALFLYTPNLERLYLNNNMQLKNISMGVIDALSRLKHLKSINLMNTGLSDEAKQLLRKALPHVTLKF